MTMKITDERQDIAHHLAVVYPLRVVAMSADAAKTFFQRIDEPTDLGPPPRPERHKDGARLFGFSALVGRPAIEPLKLAQYEQEARKDIADHAPMLAGIPTLLEVCIAGAWLFDRVQQEGGTPQEAERASEVLGQMCFPSRPPWMVAAKLLADFKGGTLAEPGEALAERLLTGDVSDLPPGGARLTTDGLVIG
jgi:hypothetical protein